jgi:hypothetical protein
MVGGTRRLHTAACKPQQGCGLKACRWRIAESVRSAVRHLASYRCAMELLHVLCKSGIGTRWHISKRQPHLLLNPSRHKDAQARQYAQAQRRADCILHTPRPSRIGQYHICRAKRKVRDRKQSRHLVGSRFQNRSQLQEGSLLTELWRTTFDILMLGVIEVSV